MMDEQKVEYLIKKLNDMLSVDGDESSVSPALSSSGGDSSSPDTIYIDETLNVEGLNYNQLLLVHVLLHRFYGSGNKSLDKSLIETLHKKVSQKITHPYFDRLDRVE